MIHIYIDLEQESEHYFNLRDNNLRMLLDSVNEVANQRFLINEVRYYGRTWYGRRYNKYRYLLYQRIDDEEVKSIELACPPYRPPAQHDVENYLMGYLHKSGNVKYHHKPITYKPTEDKHWLL